MKETINKRIYASDPRSIRNYNTSELVANFLLTDLFRSGELNLAYWEVDRTVVGGAVPTGERLELQGSPFLATERFCARRELGAINLGGAGTVTVDGKDFKLNAKDALYVGRGAHDVSFSSLDADHPASFYLLSYPAHHAYPTVAIKAEEIEPLELGSPEEANERSLYKLICPGVAESCQLVMGFTELKPGSVWNTMPPHTHARRSEVYLYFNVSADRAVMHFMGEPGETRHLVVRNLEAALSPNWSIHCGAGIGNYSFVWGMGGENQDFTDMDHLKVEELR